MHVGVSGLAMLVRRWRKHQAEARTALLCLRLVASIEVDLDWTLFFWVSRNNVVDHASRKVRSGVSYGMTPAVLWNYIFWN